MRFLVYSPFSYMMGIGFGKTLLDLPFGTVFAGLIITYATHVMTHLFNEYYDYEADLAHECPTPWTAGSRVLPNGEIPREHSLIGGYVVAGAVLAICWIYCRNQLFIVSMMVFFGWAYSAPPLRLECLGLGEAVVALVLNVLVSLFGLSIASNQGHVPIEMVSTLIFLCLVQHSRMMVMNMADEKFDRIAKKTTLVVRLGQSLSKQVYLTELVLAYAFLLIALVFSIMPSIFVFIFSVTAPIAWFQANLVLKSERTAPFFASQFNGLCMILGYVASMIYNPQVIWNTQGFILWPIVPSSIALSFILTLKPWKSY